MSDLDLSAATERAVTALVDQEYDSWEHRAHYAHAVTDVVLAAAAPVIEAQVRAQVAAEIEAAIESQRTHTQSTHGLWDGMAFAARIARGESS
jgi:hypothetical protein